VNINQDISAANLRNQILLSLITDFLDKKRYHTSKEVVAAEFGHAPMLKESELNLYFDHIPSVSVEVNGASKIFGYQQPLSVLERIIGNVIYQRTVLKISRTTQTEEEEGFTIHQRLKKIDDKFLDLKPESLKTTQSTNIRDMEKTIREEYANFLKRDMLAFKQGEMRDYRIKIDQEKEAAFHKKELELESFYQSKLKQLQDRENHLYETMQKKLEDIEKQEHDQRRSHLLKLLDYEQTEAKIKRERQIRLADIESKEERLEDLQKELDIKQRDVDILRAELGFNNEQLENRIKNDHVMRNMKVMAEDTADARKKLMEGEKRVESMQKRMEDLQANNNALHNTNAGKEAEIRQLNDQIQELSMRVKLYEMNNNGLVQQLRHQTENEAIVVHSQKEHLLNLEVLNGKYNDALRENERLKQLLVEEREQLDRQLEERTKGLREQADLFKKDKDRYVLKEELENQKKKYDELDKKFKRLAKTNINLALGNNEPYVTSSLNHDFDPSNQLNFLENELHKLRQQNPG
jgi:hypothetical protein